MKKKEKAARKLLGELVEAVALTKNIGTDVCNLTDCCDDVFELIADIEDCEITDADEALEILRPFLKGGEDE